MTSISDAIPGVLDDIRARARESSPVVAMLTSERNRWRAIERYHAQSLALAESSAKRSRQWVIDRAERLSAEIGGGHVAPIGDADPAELVAVPYDARKHYHARTMLAWSDYLRDVYLWIEEGRAGPAPSPPVFFGGMIDGVRSTLPMPAGAQALRDAAQRIAGGAS